MWHRFAGGRNESIAPTPSHRLGSPVPMNLRPPITLSTLAIALVACLSFDTAAASTAESIQTGVASFYASFFHGRKTANGERYDEGALTAAHRSLPFGTRVRVTNLDNMKSFLLRINDRGPFVGNRIIDVSRAGAKALGFVSKGLARVKVEVVGAAHVESPDYAVEVTALRDSTAASEAPPAAAAEATARQ